MRRDWTPDPLWAMATTPGETYRGWTNAATHDTYQWLLADRARDDAALVLARECASQAATAVDDFAQRLDLGDLIRVGRASPAFIDAIDFEQLLEAFIDAC